jgi:hypothetical protein
MWNQIRTRYGEPAARLPDGTGDTPQAVDTPQLEGRVAKDKAIAAPQPRKVVTLKKTKDGAAGTGKIVSIREGSHYEGGPGVTYVELRYGADPSKKEPYPDNTHRIPIPTSLAGKLRIGQRVRITIEPI